MQKRFIKRLTIEYEDGETAVVDDVSFNIRQTSTHYYQKGAMHPSQAIMRHEILWNVSPEEKT